MNILLGIIVGLLVLMALVTAHEFGHFIAARRSGVRVLEFGIGFPPRAIAFVKDPKTKKWRRLPKSEWGKKQPGLIFSLNWLPIGGFCQMDGETAEDSHSGTFGNASFAKKTKILFAGVAMNWLVGFVILTILAWTGMPTFLSDQFTIKSDSRTVGGGAKVAEVLDDSPAAAAGFLTDDLIMKVGDLIVQYPGDITNYNAEHAGEEVEYLVHREWSEGCDNCADDVVLLAKLNDADADYLLGIAMSSSQALTYSTWSAPIVGAGLTLQITGETFRGLGELVVNFFSGIGQMFSFDSTVRENGQAAMQAVGDSVSGPVGIIGVLFPSFTAAGPANLAFLAALISISLACMNVLPIPALDGGRWLLIAIYKIRRKKLDKETEQRIVARAMLILLILMAAITVLDIVRFF